MKLTVENKTTKRALREPRGNFDNILNWHFTHGYDCIDIFHMDGYRMPKEFLAKRIEGAYTPRYPVGSRLFWYVLENRETGSKVALWVNKHHNCYYTFTPPT